MAYNHEEVEKAARKKWASLNLYTADLKDESKDPYYLLVEFPYPSGDLHIGHWYAYSITDIYARMLRARGKNVLFPIGFDAFGLPAENAAIKHGVDPKEWTEANMLRMRQQLDTMGASYDWSKMVATCDPAYYKWTQWLFTKLFEQGLAERREAPVKWCPKDQTVLANEQVIDGHCERCGSAVEEKNLTQWFLKITQYAERLLEGLVTLPWREEIKEAQRAWIGKSEGAYLHFPIAGREEKIKVFTTRPDTVFGATYVVLAPEHELAAAFLANNDKRSIENADEIQAYIEKTKQKTERERSENKEKTGVRMSGIMAVNPATKEEIPVYVADYVLGSYGTGAVMAVPAHDERDFEFAQKHGLPVREVVVPAIIDRRNPPVLGKEVVERKNVHAIVRDPKTKKYLALKWKKYDWVTFPMGGIEEGESPEAAARREVEEETGFTDITLVKVLPRTARAEYFAAHKDQNRIAYTTAVLFELTGETQKERSESEKNDHDVIWLDKSKLTYEHLTHAETDVWMESLAGKECYTGTGILIESGDFTGKGSEEAKWNIVETIGGERATQYRIRDWLVSRQRYWGCPIPIVYDPSGKPHIVPAEHLPWLLPTDVDFTPSGEAAPLASSKELHERVKNIFGEGWTPECDTLDTFVDSSWYFLRYLDHTDSHDFSDQALMKKWMPVHRYSGGSEHTTMHLLYARFFVKALHDLALVPVDEPFIERFNRGLILGPDGQKMSKSKGNVINPDEFVSKYGADAVRLYLAFIGPYNEPGSYPWTLEGVTAMRKFLDRIVRMSDWAIESNKRRGKTPVAPSLAAGLAETSRKLSDDGDRFKFNTAIAQLMIFMNELEDAANNWTTPIPRTIVKELLILLAPFAPHLAEHLWEKIGGEGSVHLQPWPEHAEVVMAESEIVVQINGKRRGSLLLPPEEQEERAIEKARALPQVQAALFEKMPRRVVYVPGKIINFVV
jgi:leucyl-tRNA synthetase